MQKITPFLWFDGQAEQAAKFYVSVFKNSKLLEVTRQGGGGPRSKPKVMFATFRLDGQEFMALNGGPQFKFTPAISFFVSCKTQKEVDDLWTRLSKGGEKGQCGWLKDRFGVSWQVSPTRLRDMLHDPDPARVGRVTAAFLQMTKFDLRALETAFNG